MRQAAVVLLFTAMLLPALAAAESGFIKRPDPWKGSGEQSLYETLFPLTAGGGAPAQAPANAANNAFEAVDELPHAPLPDEFSCSGAESTARMSCDPLAAAGLGSKASTMLEAFIHEAIPATIAIKSGGGANAQTQHNACESAHKISKMMGAVQMGRAVGCRAAQTTCMKTCETAHKNLTKLLNNKNAFFFPMPVEDYQAKLSEAQKHIKSCQEYDQQYVGQLAQAMSYAQTMIGSGQCAQATKAAAAEQAKLGNGGANCSDPKQIQTNPACLCQRDPRHPSCGFRPGAGGSLGGIGDGKPPATIGRGPGAGGPGSGDASSGGGGGGSAGSLSAGGRYGVTDPSGVPGPVTGADERKANGIPQNGGGGPQLAGGSRGSSSNGYDPNIAAQAAGSGRKTDIIQGVGGGGSGGGFGGYGRMPSADSGGGRNSNLFARMKGNGLNLKNALPTHNKLAQGLAGMSKEAAKDGITGAMGESIWEKTSRQYRSQERRGAFLSGRGQ